MRFKSSIRNINTFIKLVSSLQLLAKAAWVRLDNERIRFTVVPEQGTHVWANLAVDALFEDDYTIQSAAPNNTINLEISLAELLRALRSAQNALTTSMRLTKKGDVRLLSLTITTQINIPAAALPPRTEDEFGDDPFAEPNVDDDRPAPGLRETVITQDICIALLPAAQVEGINEPRAPDPQVYIVLPPLAQIRSISERFMKLAGSASLTANVKKSGLSNLKDGPRLELSANMHGELKLGIKTEALKVESRWTGLVNPELNSEHVEGGERGIADHPSTRMREATGEESFATVRIDGRDWSKVLGVERLCGRVIASFVHECALILYVYLPHEDDSTCLTYYISSFSE